MKMKNTWRTASAVAAVALTATMLTACASEPETPEKIVTSYLEAVESGNAERAIELVNPGVSKDERTLLTNDVLKSAGKIENIVVLAAEHDGTPVDTSGEYLASNEVTIGASYDVNGKTVDVEFTAEKTSKSWKVTGGYSTVYLPFDDSVKTFELNGHKVKSGKDDSGAVVVFPGTYKVTMPSTKYLEMDAVTFNTAEGSPSFDYKVKDSIVESFDNYLATFLDNCFAATPDTRDINCPNWFYSAENAVSDVKWEMKSAPEYGISYFGGAFIIEIEKPISQHLTYTWVNDGWFDKGPKTVSTDEKGGNVEFTATVEGDEVVFTPSSNAHDDPYVYGDVVESNYR
jgi:hypothetical protein